MTSPNPPHTPLHWLCAVALPATWLAGPLGINALWFLTGPANLLPIGVGLATLLGLDALRRRRRFLAALLLVHPLLLTAWWAPRLTAPDPVDPTATPDLTLALWNLGAAVATPREAADWIAASDADIVALCELDADVAAELVAQLGDRYPHRVLHPLGVPGRGVLSRFPILADAFPRLEGERAHLELTLDVDGRPLGLTVVHLSLFASLLGRAEGSVRDLDPLTERLAGRAPGLLVGDFNSAETSALYRSLAARGLVDTFREAGRGFGFSFPLPGRYKGVPLPPFVRIDHVWRTDGLVATAARLGADGGGDHLPLLVALRFDRPSGSL